MEKSISDEPSAELLAYMGIYREEEPQEAEAAFNVFYQRHVRFVTTEVYKVCYSGALQSPDIVNATVNNTFVKVYMRAETFDPGDFELGSTEMGSRIKAWLSKIAKNEFRILIRNSVNKEREADQDSLEIDYLNSETLLVEDEFISLPRKLIEDALATLSKREKDVLLTYMRFQDGNKKLPDGEMAALTTYHSTTPSNVRVIKHRAKKKVKQYIRDNSDFEID